MARKGNQNKNASDRQSSNQKKKVSESESKGRGKSQVKVAEGEKLPNGTQRNSTTKSVTRSDCVGDDDNIDQSGPYCCNSSPVEASESIDSDAVLSSSDKNLDDETINWGSSLNELHIRDLMGTLLNNELIRRFRDLALSVLKEVGEWLKRKKPLFLTLTSNISEARVYAQMKLEQVYPIILRWLIHLANIMFLLFMIWLDCTLRGIDSFVRMGTTSFFSVVWCSVFSVIGMIGWLKFLSVLAVSALAGVVVGFFFAIFAIVISATIFLWFYGSFWTTALVVFLGGLAFMARHERVALLITTAYSVYCAWAYVGWLGLLLGLNLSFISSDALIYFLRNNVSEHGRPNGPGLSNDGPADASSSEFGTGRSADRSPGVPSTSGADELTSENEVVRLLNCADHYSALGLSRYENIDVSLLKREYRKKAMLVHPDKNMGNDKAAEAFKKLQNAYEVLLDSLKRKAYDDELRREELLNYFRRFQSTSQKNGGNGLFASGFARPEAEAEDILGESRRIACKKCGNFHLWVHTKKTKSQARWCQDCNDFHQAKDGDGWVEQSSQPFLFGILQKVDTPSAYVCAESRIYDATEWYICQGMRCPANTHKPSFHVNTSVTSNKHNSSGRATSSGQRGGMPIPNMEATMTEEELYEMLKSAVNAGIFDDFVGTTSSESPSAKAKSGSNSGGGKKKKKGKKQW